MDKQNKKREENNGINLSCTGVEGLRVSIFKLEEDKLYLCSKINFGIKETDPVQSVIIKCTDDEKVIKFCEQNELKNIRNRSLNDELHITARVLTKNIRSLDRIIEFVRGEDIQEIEPDKIKQPVKDTERFPYNLRIIKKLYRRKRNEMADYLRMVG